LFHIEEGIQTEFTRRALCDGLTSRHVAYL